MYTVFLFFSLSVYRLLSTAQGSLLDDEKLVNTLQSSKATALDVQNQLEVNQHTETEIDTARQVCAYMYMYIPYCNMCACIVYI